MLASMFLALDPDLLAVRERAVPDLITEEEFWRNFFFQIERVKQAMQLENGLGQQIDVQTIEKGLTHTIEENKKLKFKYIPKWHSDPEKALAEGLENRRKAGLTVELSEMQRKPELNNDNNV